ncbi:MAG: DUF2752 domain-containing protein [Verrucomicrobiae bacterium]|nr:DUF2752 domain-containing protein [Verrucomicrobiae bacterium]NNJ44297.1 DUF2752 domain-containing protein [Akkermansiaceae bacterium]
MKTRPLWPLLLLVLVPGWLFLFVAVTDQLQGEATQCAIKKFTDLHCPGCGGTRCAQRIVSGDWIAAMGFNAMLMTGLGVIMTVIVFTFVRMTLLGKNAPPLPQINACRIGLVIGAITLFTLLRNTPIYPFTLLAP